MKVKSLQLYPLNNTFKKLMLIEYGDFETTRKVFKLNKQIQVLLNSLTEFRHALETKTFQMDENSQIKVDDTGNPIIQEGKTLDKYLEDLSKLLDEEVELPLETLILHESELKTIKFSANELSFIDDLIVD